MIHFDCHAHVYERISAIPGARYSPASPAPLSSWIENLESHDLKGGIIVQVSFLGTDNSELCAALAKLDRARFAGVAVVALDVDDLALGRLVASGIRGVRWNLVGGDSVPNIKSPIVQDFFAKLRQKKLHLEVHLEGPRLARHLAELTDQGVNVVIDHYGLPSDPHPRSDPMLNAVALLPYRENLFFKFSAHYRSKFDLTPHSMRLLDLLDDHHIVWGSDWPHTQHENSVNYNNTFIDAAQRADISDIEVARHLYGISSR
ncbi:MAG: amidohydrolase family protein [Pseudomonadota bacterium]